MADHPDHPSALPAHIDQTIQSIARLHGEHHQTATRLQRVIDRLTARLSRPPFVVTLTILVGGWVAANLIAVALGLRAIDSPPFPWLNCAASLVSVYMVVLVLATQRREEELAEHREQLTLELAILIEQKTTKVIRLLEEARRDNPLIHDRGDREAEAMAQPADLQSVLHAIKETHAEAQQGRVRPTGD